MARITLRASSSCVKGDAYATVSLARVWPLAVAASVLALPVPPCAQGGTAATSTGTQAPPTSQAKPPPTDQAAQPAAAPDPLAEDTRSLFAPSWNMFQLSGRVSSVAGDPARWQRYQDLGDGLLFTAGTRAA